MKTIYRKRDGFGTFSLYQRIEGNSVLEVETMVEPMVCFYTMDMVAATSTEPYEIGTGKYACSEEEFCNACLGVLEALKQTLDKEKERNYV
jgi:hypothetical protein